MIGNARPCEWTSGDRCPVTGWPVLRRPEWTEVNFGGTYRATFSLIGDHILLVETAGRATFEELEQALLLDTRVKDVLFPHLRPYVRIEHWSRLQGASRSARDLYMNHVKNDRRLLGLIFFGLPSFFKAAVRIAGLTNRPRFQVDVVENYHRAVKRAQELLSVQGFNSAPGVSNGPAVPAARDPLTELSSRTVTRKDWHLQIDGCSVHYEVIDGNVLHAIKKGIIGERLVLDANPVRERVAQALGCPAGSYFYVAGLADSPGISPKARRTFVSSLLEFYQKYPFRMIIFYGANKFFQAAINLSKPFAPYKSAVVKDLRQALDLIKKTGSPLPPTVERGEVVDSIHRHALPEGTGPDVRELLHFIDNLNWGQEGDNADRVRDPSHPFAPVFAALELMKWEFDDLLRDQKRIQAELTRAKEAAESANLAKSAFLSNMSHELRTPLSAVIGFAELILERGTGDLTAKQEQYVRIIAESGRHLLALINEILDLAKVEAGKTTLEVSPVAVTSLLEHSLTLFKETCLKHGIRQALDVKDEAQGIIVLLDERKIRQVLYNLLSNAVKFTPDGGRIGIEATVLPSPDDAQGTGRNLPVLQVSVLDTGVGLAPEDRERVFEAFYQVRGGMTNKTPGAGLGLALVRQMAELHGGRVWAESEGEGKGSAFRFTIPFQPGLSSESAGRQSPASSLRGDAQAQAFSRIADLIVDYREAIGSFSIGRLRPASADVPVDQDSILKELEAAKRAGDAVLADAQGNFILLLRADHSAAQAACRRLSERLESRVGGAWLCAVAGYPEDGRSAQELMDTMEKREESPR